jgi:hypothetical protein
MYTSVIMPSSNDFPLNVELKPLGYDRNPITGRLNKKCKNGFERYFDNITKKMKCYKKCKPNEVRNMKTKRCRAKSQKPKKQSIDDTVSKTRKMRQDLTQKILNNKRKTISKTPSFDFDDVYSNVSDLKESFPLDIPKVERTPSFGMDEVYSASSDIDAVNPKGRKNKSSKSKSKSPFEFDAIYDSISDFNGSNPRQKKNKSSKSSKSSKKSSASKSPLFGLDEVYKINSDFEDSNSNSNKVIVGFRKQKGKQKRRIRFQ